jgi:hypothetical protein
MDYLRYLSVHADQQAAVWGERYLVVQGRRVAWWSNVKQLEAGRSAECLLLLQGHAGVSGASPLELRDAEVCKVQRV